MILGLGNVTPPPPPPCSQRKGEIEKQLGESKEMKERVILKKKIRTWETNFSAIIIVLGQGLFGGLREIRERIYRGLCHVSERMTFFFPSACKLVCYHSLMWHCYVTSFYSFFFHNLISLCLSVVWCSSWWIWVSQENMPWRLYWTPAPWSRPPSTSLHTLLHFLVEQ